MRPFLFALLFVLAVTPALTQEPAGAGAQLVEVLYLPQDDDTAVLPPKARPKSEFGPRSEIP